MTAPERAPSPRPIRKSPTAFRTISEVSAELDVPQHVLRFWETKFPQVKPLKRGGGRRYYRPEDVALVARIRELLYREGYTIKGVQRLLRGGAAASEVVRGGFRAAEPAAARDPAPAAEPTAAPRRSLDAGARTAIEDTLRELIELRDLLAPVSGDEGKD